MVDRAVFLFGYGCMGILPLVQLRLLWRFAPAPMVGHILFIATLAIVISTLCDGNLSFRTVDSSVDSIAAKVLKVCRLRLIRLILVTPIVFGLVLIKGAALSFAVSVVCLSGAYSLNYAFIYRNSGSISRALSTDFAMRALCQLAPVAGAFALGEEVGVVAGCMLALTIQMLVVTVSFGLDFGDPASEIKAAVSRDVFSGMLGVLYSVFCQAVSAFVLSTEQFARFISVDRLVRSSLLITEPCRLWYLRKSWTEAAPLALTRILRASLLVATVSTLAVSLLFSTGISSYILHSQVSTTYYILVAFFLSFVSFISLCAFVRHRFVMLANGILFAGLLVGGIAYWSLVGKGPFAAAFALEFSVALAFAVGSLATRVPSLGDP